MIVLRKNVRIRAAGIIVKDGKLLLIAHKKGSNIYWLLPGGGVQYRESLEEALRREIYEELHIDVAVDRPALICDTIAPNGKRHIVNICFYCLHANGDPILGKDKRLYDFRFFARQELNDLTIFPPIHASLDALFDMGHPTIYLGKVWADILNV